MLKTNSKDLSIEYWLNEIKILTFELSESEDEFLDNQELKMNLSLDGDYNKEEKKVTILVLVTIYKENKIDVAKLKVRYVFKINYNESLNDNNEVLLPENLLNTFNNVAVSTTRGILFTKFQATNIDNFILPLIKINKISKLKKAKSS